MKTYTSHLQNLHTINERKDKGLKKKKKKVREFATPIVLELTIYSSRRDQFQHIWLGDAQAEN